MEFKLASYQDYERIAALHSKNWKQFNSGILSDEYLNSDVNGERLAIWQTRLTNPPFNQRVILAEEGGLLCGFICAFGKHDYQKGTIIDALHVDPAYRGRGLGRQLIQQLMIWVEQYFPDSGIYLEVLRENQQAIRFYTKIGGVCESDRVRLAPCGTEVEEQTYIWPTTKQLSNGISS